MASLWNCDLFSIWCYSPIFFFQRQYCWCFCQREIFDISPTHVPARNWSVSKLRYLCCRHFSLLDGACLSADWKSVFYPLGFLQIWLGIFCLQWRSLCSAISQHFCSEASQLCWTRSAVMDILACSVITRLWTVTQSQHNERPKVLEMYSC